jgi:bifunctional non-homologous end joining protein LigD
LKTSFFEPMLLLRTETFPEAAACLYELKLDGFRALAIQIQAQAKLRSRNDNDFSSRYPAIVKVLASLSDCTVINGEVVALDESGDRRSTSPRTTARRSCVVGLQELLSEWIFAQPPTRFPSSTTSTLSPIFAVGMPLQAPARKFFLENSLLRIEKRHLQAAPSFAA